MPIHQDEFQTFMRELVTEAEGSPDGLSGIDLLAEMCGRLHGFWTNTRPRTTNGD